MHTRTLPAFFPLAKLPRIVVLFAVTVALCEAAIPLTISVTSSAPQTYSPTEYPTQSNLALRLSNNPTPPGTLQWYHGDSPISGATNSTLILESLSPTDAGNYRVRLTSGADISESSTVVVNVLTVPRTVDTSFTSLLPADFKVANVTAFSSDGSFIALSGDASTPPVRLTADGSVVAGFHFPVSAGEILAGFPDGRLIVSKAPYVLAADGSALSFTLPAVLDSTKPITSAAVADNGKFYLGQGNKIVGLLADGSVDAAFSFANPLDETSDILGVDRQYRLLVRGVRRDPDPTHFPFASDMIYRLTPSGGVEKELLTVYQQKGDRGRAVLLGDGRILAWSSYEGIYTWHMFHEDGTEVPNYTGTFLSNRAPVIDALHGFIYKFADIPFGARLSRGRFGATGIQPDLDFYAGPEAAFSIPALRVDPSGKLLYFTGTSSWQRHATQNLARINTDVPAPALPPLVSISVSEITPRHGATVTFNSAINADGAYTYEWLPLDQQPALTGATTRTAFITNFSGANLGRYQLRLNGAFGTVLSNVVELTPRTPDLPYLANLSGRAIPGPGENTTIAGITTHINAGAFGSPLLIRGVGPALKDLGVSNYLPNPAVNLFNTSGAIVANNDNWAANPEHDAIRSNAAVAGAFAFAENSLDAALLKTSYNQQFTAQLFDMSGQSGVGLLEVYRLPDGNPFAELTNLSFRAHTAPGDATAIAGFVITDPQNLGRSARVLLRVIGPTLASQGIVHPLADPVLTLFNSKGEVIRRIDNWGDDADVTTLTATMKQVGAFDLPANSKDAAVVLDLPASVYTMHATGGEGVVLMEIYLVR